MRVKNRLALFIGSALALASAALTAGSVGTLTTFTAGTTAKAGEVNGNFTAVEAAVDDNDARIATVETTVNGGNVVLAPSTSSSGNILKGAEPFLHDFGNANTFLGRSAGNFTMSGLGGNTGVGFNAFQSNTTGNNNTGVGANTLLSNSTGSFNTATGVNALKNNADGGLNTAGGADALFSNTSGNANTAIGVNALFANTNGGDNTAVGASALSNNTSGSNNTATGRDALMNNSSGTENTGTGRFALFSNTTGSFNTAIGSAALLSNATGDQNTAIGVSALRNNVDGFQNTASGLAALRDNTSGNFNTANGVVALAKNTTGSNNTAVGFGALQNNASGLNNTAGGMNALAANTIGASNVAYGLSALASNTAGGSNVAIGVNALLDNVTGNSNIAIGVGAGQSLTGSNNIAIGSAGVAGESSTIRLGQFGNQTRTFIVGIRGVTTGVANAVNVVIDSNGQLGTVNSSRRTKDHIAAMDTASDVLMQLRPVTFYYKSDRNPKGRGRQYGLIAEEVAEIAPDLVAHSADGRIETVYYRFLAPMLLNEYQKQQRAIARQAARLDDLERDRRAQSERIEALERRIAQLAERAAANPISTVATLNDHRGR